MDGLGSSEWMPVSKTQQGSDGQMRAGAPAQTLSLVQASGDQSHLPHIDQSFECHGEPTQQSCFPREGRDVRPFDRIPSHEVTAATAQPCTPVHQPRGPAQTGGDKTQKAPRRPRIKLLVKHTKQNDREIQNLDPHLRSIVLYYFGNSEVLQVFALNRILEYRDQQPRIHICRVERKNGDPRGMILLVICLLCPPGPEAPSPFTKPNALPKFAHHFRTFHCDIKHPFACIVPPCDKSFSLRHDMARHVKAAHSELDGTAGDIEDGILDSVAASNATGPSNARRASKGSSPVVALHNTSSFPSSTAGPSHRMTPYRPRPIAPPPPNQDYWNTMNAGVGSADGARPSTGHQSRHMMALNALRVNQSSSNRPIMSFHDAHGELYGGLSHIPASGSNVPTDYLCSHAQRTQGLDPFLLSGNPGGNPVQIQPRQLDSSKVVAQMALPVTSNYPMNAMAENRFAQARQNHMSSASVQGPRQYMSTRATTRAVTQQRYDSNATSMSTRHAQALRHEADYMAIESARLAHLLSGPRSRQPGSQYYNLGTSSQTSHAVFVQQPQPQHPLQNGVDTTLGHQHTPYSPWELPQTSLNMESWPFTGPSLDPRFPRTSRNNRTRAQPPQHLGHNVSSGRKTLKGVVERILPLWLISIELMVGVSEAFLSAILVLLGPPRERKGCISTF